MASFHSRSNSFPSQSHPVINDVEDHLERLKASQATSTSSICANLATLTNLHESINSLIEMPSTQQSLSHDSINELVEGSLQLVDICAVSRDVLCLTKESIRELESSIRRKSDDINAYLASRKKITKMVNKCIKNLKSSKQNSTALPEIGKLLKEAETIGFSFLKSVLIVLSVEKERSNKRSWSTLLSKSTQLSCVHSEDLCFLNIEKSSKSMDSNNMLKQLKASEMRIEEIEEGLEALFKSLVKNRVSLLNVLSH